MSKIKNGGLDHYGAEPVEQQQFGTAGVEGVNTGIIILEAPDWNLGLRPVDPRAVKSD